MAAALLAGAALAAREAQLADWLLPRSPRASGERDGVRGALTLSPCMGNGRARFHATMGAMPLKDPSFTIGIEEEYLLVDRASRDLVREMPHGLFEAAQQALQGQVAREFLKSQIEVGTGVHTTPARGGCRAGAACARTVAQARRRARPGADRRLHPSLRALEHAGADRARALPGHRPAISPASAAASSSAACTCTSASRTTSCASTS